MKLSFSRGRRARLAVVLGVAMVAAVAVPVMAAAPWEDPTRSIQVTDPDGGSLDPLDTVRVDLGGFASDSSVGLAVCARDLYDYFAGGNHDPATCSDLSQVQVDATGAASVDYVLPEVELSGTVFRQCTASPFGFSFKSPCAIVAFAGTPPRAAVAADITFTGDGTATVSGSRVDATTSAAVSDGRLSVCDATGQECVRPTVAADGSFVLTNLDAGDYSVRSDSTYTPDPADPEGPGLGYAGNAVGFSLAEGEQLSGLTVAVVPFSATSGPIGRSGRRATIDPPQPKFDDTITVTGTGFTPGAAVVGGLCMSVYPNVGPDGLGANCDAAGDPVVAAPDGTATVVLPFDPDVRFVGVGGDGYDAPCTLDDCVAFLHETTRNGGGAWTDVSFVKPAGSASISGAVRMSDGSTLPWTYLSICGPIGCTYINNNGGTPGPTLPFQSDGLPDGTYTLTANSFSEVSLNASTTVTITAQQSVSDLDLILTYEGGTGSISGTVTDQDGDPMKAVSINICKATLAGPCSLGGRYTSTGEDGTYRARFLDDGTYRVSATTYLTGRTTEVSALVDIVDGAAVTQNLALPVDVGSGSITGTIVDQIDTPRSGSVTACRYLENLTSDCRSAGTAFNSQDGAFTLPDLPDGTWRVYAYGGGTSSREVPVVVDGGDATAVTLVLPLVTGGGSVTGTVVDEGGDVVPNAGISLCTLDAPTDPYCGFQAYYYSASADSDGEFSRLDLPDGAYQVRTRGLNYYGANTTVIEIVDGAAVTTGEIVIPVDFGAGAIRGTTKDSNGLPVSTWVNACSDALTDCFYDYSGSDGFSIENLPDGTYDLNSYFDGSGQTVQDVTVANGEITSGIDIVFPVTTGAISGTVLDELGQPVDGGSLSAVWACNTTTFDCDGGQIGADGTYVVGGLEDGLYTVTAFTSLGTTSTSAVVQNSNLTTGVDLVYDSLEPVPEGVTIGHISGTDESDNTGGPIYRGVATPLSLQACPGGTGTWALDFPGDAGDATGSLGEGPAGTYTGSIQPDEDRAGEGQLEITVDCPTGPDLQLSIDVYIDPSGFVRDTDGAAISGATVTLLRAESADGPFTVVPDGSSVMSPANRTNPDTTKPNGHFGWDVTAGFYKVTAQKDGCRSPEDRDQQVVETQVYEIPPPVTDIDLRLDCSDLPVDDTAPTVEVITTPAPNDAGWNDGPVTVTLSGADEVGGSGLDQLTLGDTTSSEPTLSTTVDDQGERTLPYSAIDRAGNSTDGSVTLRIDSTDPVVTGQGALGSGATVTLGADVSAAYTCSDELSGIATCAGSVGDGEPLDTSAPGTFTVDVEAVDVAGNSTMQSLTYTVVDAAEPVAALDLEAKGVLARYSVQQSFDQDPFVLRVGRDGVVTRLAGRTTVTAANGERLDVSVDINRSLLWTFGRVNVRNTVTGDRADGVLLFAPPIKAAVTGDRLRVTVNASFLSVVGTRAAPTSVRLVLEQ